MTSVRAIHHDGRTGDAHDVLVTADADHVRIEGDGLSLRYPLEAVILEPRLGTLPRRLDLPSGGSCLVDPAFELPATPGAAGTGIERWVHVLERKWSVALAAAAALAVSVWAAIVLVVPSVARHIAMGITPSTEATIAGQTLAALDRMALRPTKLSEERQSQLAGRFARLSRVAGAPGGYALVLRSSPSIGPNAFALPGGTIVVLDELVAIAEHDDEIAAVMAHEIGHVRERHALRSVIQSSVSALLVATIVGDALSASSYAAALPAVMLETRYSRGFEREADRVAIELMKRDGIDPGHFGRILLRMDGRAGKAGRYPDFLSSHPSSAERARAAAGQ
jgi:predicted Zn-dependent protease